MLGECMWEGVGNWLKAEDEAGLKRAFEAGEKLLWVNITSLNVTQLQA